MGRRQRIFIPDIPSRKYQLGYFILKPQKSSFKYQRFDLFYNKELAGYMDKYCQTTTGRDGKYQYFRIHSKIDNAPIGKIFFQLKDERWIFRRAILNTVPDSLLNTKMVLIEKCT